MSAHGDNATIGSSPYYFRHTTRESAKPQDDRTTPRQNGYVPSSLSSLNRNLILEQSIRYLFEY